MKLNVIVLCFLAVLNYKYKFVYVFIVVGNSVYIAVFTLLIFFLHAE
jgi:hypothetical protein